MKLRNLTLATTVILLPSPAYADSIYFCEACQPGTYGDGKSCIDCPAGKYASSVGSSSCTKCAAGTYSGARAKSCTECAAGTYSGAGSSSCYSCSSGYYSNAGASSCTKCLAGTYSGAKASSCTKCSAGTYASSAGSSSCTKCPAGKYASSTGSSSCSNCPAGKYASSTGSSSCSNCPAGQYTSSAGSSSCTNCPAGTYASSSGSSSCASCPAGTYASSSGSSSCRSCLTIGAATCDSTTGRVTGCKAGYGYSSDGTCTQCEIGYYSAGGTNTCTTCDEPTINGSENWFTYWYAKATDETINTCYSNSTTYSNKLEADDYYAQCVYDANYKQSDKVKMTLGKWKISVERTATPECRDGCYASANAFNSKYYECVKGCESPVEQEMECGPIYKTKTTYCTEKGSSSSTANPKTTDIEESIGGCPAGQTCLNGRCEPCPYGQYKSGTGWEKCRKKSKNIQNGGSCSRQCHFIEFHQSGCCWIDLWATCGALAAAGSVMDVGTFTALSTTPVGLCLMASGNLNYWPRECSGTSSTIYGINEGRTDQTALYQCK